jgi:hypothetical protein
MSRLDEATIDYGKLEANLETWKRKTDTTRPLTLAEKVVYSHLDDLSQKVRACDQ